MGEEPTCVMSAFSYTCSSSSSSGIHEHSEGNPVYGMGGGESVSLGRYMSESLCWEKWSSFSRNRYVEEAEQYSKPGSVAQKKAYFEAHFKRMAALKAAALLEQANAASAAGAASKQDNHPNMNMIKMTTQGEINHHHNTGCKIDLDHSQQKNNTPAGNKGQETDAKFVGNSKIEEDNSIVMGNGKIEAEEEGEESSPPTHGNLSEVEHKNSNIIIVTQKEKSKLQQDKNGKQQQEEDEGTSSPMIKKNPPLSSYMLPSVDVSVRTQFVSSTKPIAAAGKENYATPAANNKCCVQHKDTDSNKRTPLRRSINRELNKLFSPVLRKIGGNSTKGGLKDKDCSTPLNTPTAKPYVVDDYIIQNSPSEVPQPSSKRGVRALFEASKSENKAYSPSGLQSPPSPSRNKINSPIIPTLCLRNREKTTRRKENLEEKFNAKATPRRSQQQSKFKGKAEAEFSKLRRSFCFKSTPMSDFHGQTDTLSRIPIFKQKSQLLHNPSSTKEKKTTTTSTNRSQNNDLLPPRRPALKGSLKHSHQ